MSRLFEGGSVIKEYLVELITSIHNSLTFNSSALKLTAQGDQGWAVALGITVLAGFSVIVGKLVVLAINQLRGVRLYFAGAIASLAIAFEYLVLATALWGLGRFFLDDLPELSLVIKTVMLSAGPMLFFFLTFIPIIGTSLGYLFSAWSLGIMWGLCGQLLNLKLLPALAMTLGAWILMHLVSYLLGKTLAGLRDWIWLKMTGRQLLLSSQAIRDAYPQWEAEHKPRKAKLARKPRAGE